MSRAWGGGFGNVGEAEAESEFLSRRVSAVAIQRMQVVVDVGSAACTTP